MKRIVIAAAAAMLMVGGAQAQQARSGSPLYGELGYSFMNVEGFGFDADPQALRGIIGYNAHPYFAVEGMLAFGTSSDSGQKVKNSIGVFLKPKYDFNNLEVFGRLGWAQTELGGPIGGRDSDFAYGVGVNYNFNPRTYVGLDWMSLADKDGVKINGVTVSIGYRF